MEQGFATRGINVNYFFSVYLFSVEWTIRIYLHHLVCTKQAVITVTVGRKMTNYFSFTAVVAESRTNLVRGTSMLSESHINVVRVTY